MTTNGQGDRPLRLIHGWGLPRTVWAALDEPLSARCRWSTLDLPGYGGTQAERLAAARKIMAGLGYGPGKRLKIKVSTRDFQAYKDPAVLLVDQLNQIYFDAELEIVESSVWYGRAGWTRSGR